MNKQIAFCNKDKKLVEKIIEYQQENGIQSFTEAVRQLCKEALDCTVNVKINLKQGERHGKNQKIF